MTEDELRALVRDAIARRQPVASEPSPVHHASHAMFVKMPSGGDAGACVIEPNVPCTHCGFCKSYGH